ncbi:hypothetical protein GC194_07905 [bacterium]|nr:hypothetical protein [bacterium]
MIVVGEHHNGKPLPDYVDLSALNEKPYKFFFDASHNQKELCFHLQKKSDDDEDFHLETNYYLGVDWVLKNKLSIQVQPKFNKNREQDGQYVEIDFKAMLAEVLLSKKATNYLHHLYQIKWHDPLIELDQKEDLLTPFLVMEYLNLLKTIVRKGLRKGYYKVQQNLQSKVKGKILVSQTIKHNHAKGNFLNTHCAFEEFGFNTPENRLLKKALEFVKAYLPKYFNAKTNATTFQNAFNYIDGAFGQVNSQIELTEVKAVKRNPFFKEYNRATNLAKLILKRYGYKESNVSKTKIKTPPYWINMAMLFELFVLSKLEKSFVGKKLHFQFPEANNVLDFLLDFDEENQFVADAKYKGVYKEGGWETDNVRQLSGYARLTKVLKELRKDENDVVNCLILYPDEKNGKTDLSLETIKSPSTIKSHQYAKMYKLGVQIPIVNNNF